MTKAPDDILKSLLDAALAAADPYGATLKALPPPAKGRNVVIGAGKASARMAEAAEARYGDEIEGFVIVPKGYGAPLNHIRIIEAAHPVPDAAGETAARAALDLAGGLGENDRLLALISGGGSALMALPAKTISLIDKQRITGELLKCGAAITEINTIRKHLSAIKGGWLARAAHPAVVETYLVSDIPGDDPAMVASGPTLRDPTTGADALALLAAYGIDPGDPLRQHLLDPTADTPEPDDACFKGERLVIVARAADALAAAAEKSMALGLKPILLGDDLEGEALELAAQHARLALEEVEKGGAPAVLISGGETTVTLRGQGKGQGTGQGTGKGGRNTEYALALALALDGAAGIHAIAADTDGVDGAAVTGGGRAAAGAVITPTTLARARAQGLDAGSRLEASDSASLFAALGDLVVTGPTLTNVNDFRALIVGPARA